LEHLDNRVFDFVFDFFHSENLIGEINIICFFRNSTSSSLIIQVLIIQVQKLK